MITALSALSSIIIVIVTIYYWYSNLLFVPSPHSLRKADPFTIPFQIRNNSIFTLNNVEIMAQINSVHGEIKPSQHFTLKGIGLTTETTHILKANTSDTYIFELNKWIEPKYITIDKADVQINISYKVSILPFSFTEKFRFIAMETENGTFEYYPINPAPITKTILNRVNPPGSPLP